MLQSVCSYLGRLILVASILMCASAKYAYAVTDSEADAAISKFVAFMVTKLPMRDAAAGLTTIKVYSEPNRKIIIQIIDDVPASRWTNDMRSEAKQIFINNYCTNPEMRLFTQIGAKIKYMVFDKSMTYLHGTTVEPSNCR